MNVGSIAKLAAVPLIAGGVVGGLTGLANSRENNDGLAFGGAFSLTHQAVLSLRS